MTMGPKEWRFSGHMLALRGIRQYVGVGGYDMMWMRPAFADGLVFTRSVNRANGKGAILCWDLRARPDSTWVKFGVTEPARGLPGAHNYGEALPNGVTRWIVNLKQAACIDPDPPLDQRRDMYIVVDRTADGEQESWARARLLNIATHEVDLTEFTPGDKTLTLKGTVLFHSDRYVNPSSQRPGV